MFYLLCFSLVLAVMFAIFALTALASLPALRVLAGLKHRVSAGATANLLFLFRALPLALGLAASLGLALPAFLKFEPSSTHEMPGPALLLMAGLGLLIVLTMAWRGSRILRLTLSLQSKWLKNSTPFPASFKGIPVFCVEGTASLVAVAGIFTPRIFVSRDVADALNGTELNAALAHELAHVGASDNLRQLLLKATQAPGFLRFFADIDSLWASTSELAADERAIAQGASPLDLSSALVKVGRLSFERRSPLLAASHLVEGCSSATSARVGHLRNLLERGVSPKRTAAVRDRRYWWLAGAGLALLVYLFALGTILPQVHEALEFIVR